MSKATFSKAMRARVNQRTSSLTPSTFTDEELAKFAVESLRSKLLGTTDGDEFSHFFVTEEIILTAFAVRPDIRNTWLAKYRAAKGER